MVSTVVNHVLQRHDYAHPRHHIWHLSRFRLVFLGFDQHVGGNICVLRSSALLIPQAPESVCACQADSRDNPVPIRLRRQFVPRQLQLDLVRGTWVSRAPLPVPRPESHGLRQRGEGSVHERWLSKLTAARHHT